MKEHFYNDYAKAKAMAKKWGMIEAEYGDTGQKYNGQDVSYVCYNKTGDQNGEYNIICYYTWRRNEETGRLIPCKLNKEAYIRALNY